MLERFTPLFLWWRFQQRKCLNETLANVKTFYGEVIKTKWISWVLQFMLVFLLSFFPFIRWFGLKTKTQESKYKKTKNTCDEQQLLKMQEVLTALSKTRIARPPSFAAQALLTHHPIAQENPGFLGASLCLRFCSRAVTRPAVATVLSGR